MLICVFNQRNRARNLNVAGEDDLGKNQDETTGEMLSGLNCKVWVQFENYDEFYNAMKVLCGRSLQKVTMMSFTHLNSSDLLWKLFINCQVFGPLNAELLPCRELVLLMLA